MRTQLESNPLVDVRYGVKFETLEETVDGVESTLTADSGKTFKIKCKYLLGCDGAGSRVRRAMGIESEGGQV